MKKITLEMPMVTNCMASDCAYNVNSGCDDGAIPIDAATLR